MSTSNDAKKTWEDYCKTEIAFLKPILELHGFILDEVQPHISGERFLMYAVTTSSGKKLILLGQEKNGGKVVIKATHDSAGKGELTHERNCREILKKLDFAGEIFHTPEEISFIEIGGYIITVQRFIKQPYSFLDRPLPQQFSLALLAFKGQESAHATTFKHRKVIAKTFGIRNKDAYLNAFAEFENNITEALPENSDLLNLLNETRKKLRENEQIIEQYTGFLTHTDFVPHNIRIDADNTIYLLDHSSLTFGNKYEGWARFINFMALHNPKLQELLENYVKDNRTAEESTCLHLMRLYRLGEIIWYYTNTLSKCEGNLYMLNASRVNFWTQILHYVLNNKIVPMEIVDSYTKTRDSLRSDDEKKRQQGLH